MHNKTTYYAVFGGLTAVLLLVGFGCVNKINSSVDAGLQPVTVPLQALQKSKEELAEEQAKRNRDNESVANESTVALILTEGAVPPAGAKIGETIGCNDKVALTTVARVSATDDPIHDALMSLFDVRESTHNQLYNSLYQSKLTVDRIISPDGVTTEVWLKGDIASGGVCDDPRIKAQIEGTVKRLRPVYKIYLNGTEAEYQCIGNMKEECSK
jgi:hypothetical protein